MRRLEGRVALITGASRGIGKAIALRFAAEGARLALVARSMDALSEVETACLAAGAAGASPFALDVTDTGAVDSTVKAVASAMGGIDILVNNAGITRDNILLRLKDDDWDQVLSTNLRAAFALSRAAARYLMKSKHGRVISIASVIGITGNAGQSNYAASKAGLIGFTKSLAKELASRSVTANIIAPGFIETDMTASLDEVQKKAILSQVALARYGTGNDVAAAAAFLASDDAAYMTGQILVVDGGMVI